jgi:hypothetical protein
VTVGHPSIVCAVAVGNTAVVAFASNQRVAAMLGRALLVSERFLADNFL